MSHNTQLSSPSPAMLAAVLALMTAVLFWPATGYDFVKLDDVQYVVDNPHVATGLSAANVRWAFTTVHEHWWLPILWISYMLDTDLFGTEPFGYHLTNVLLHMANAALLFWLLFRITGSRWRSFFVAAFFALHPLRVESVAWIAERKDVLSGFFFLLTLMAYVRHVKAPSRIRFWLIHVWMALGLMSKSMLVIVPPLLLLLDWWPLRRAGDPCGPGAWSRWRPLLAEKWAVIGLASIFILLNVCTHRDTLVSVEGLSWPARTSLIFPNYWDYLGKIFWPAHLSAIYPPHDAVNWFISVLSAAGLMGFTLLAWQQRKDRPFLLVGWLWFLIALFPVIRGVRFDAMLAYADRYTYLPSMGLGLAVVWGVADRVADHSRAKTSAVIIAIVLLAACFARSQHRLPAWEDAFTTLSELIDYAPDHYEANRDFGYALMERGRTEEALGYLARASEVEPNQTEAVAAYADALLRLGRTEEAVDWLLNALATRDADDPALNNLLGFAYLDLDQADLAIAPLRKALEIQPGNLGWRISLIRALFEAGHSDAAYEEIRRLQADGYQGIRAFDDLIPHYINWWRGGEKRHAWHFFRNAIRNQPDHILLLNTAAWLLATDPEPPAELREAVRFARRAVELAPAPHPSLLDTLAAALAADGQWEEAVQTSQQAIALARQGGDQVAAARMELRLTAYRQGRPWRE